MKAFLNVFSFDPGNNPIKEASLFYALELEAQRRERVYLSTHSRAARATPDLRLRLPRLAGSWPAMWVVFPGLGPAATLKPNLKPRGPTSPVQTIEER